MVLTVLARQSLLQRAVKQLVQQDINVHVVIIMTNLANQEPKVIHIVELGQPMDLSLTIECVHVADAHTSTLNRIHIHIHMVLVVESMVDVQNVLQ